MATQRKLALHQMKHAATRARDFLHPKRLFNFFMMGVIVISILPAVAIVSLIGGTSYAANITDGPRTATATGDCVNNTGIGTEAWTNPGNAFSANSTYATASVDATISNYVHCTNFGFNVPAGSTIRGITMSLTRHAASTANGGTRDSAVRIIRNGTVGTTDRATSTIYTTSATSENHGGATDLWGTTWNTTTINASNFGAAVAVIKPLAAGAAITVSIDVIQLSVTYDTNPTINQSGYRWFENTDSTNVGAPLNGVAQNTAVTLAGQTNFRLRLLAHVTVTSADPGSAILSLQYAVRGADNLCDTSFTNESYSNVGTTTVVAFADNPSAADASALTSNANDPSHSSDTKVNQTYEEANVVQITNTIPVGQDGMWDFSLKINDAPPSTTYCFRLSTSLGAALSGGYSAIPQISTAAAGLNQENYRWLQGQDSTTSSSFVQTWGGGGPEGAAGAIQTADGGYAIAGVTQSYDIGNGDMYLAKFDASGALAWSRVWGGTNDEFVYDLIQAKDGGLLVTGTTYGLAGGDGVVFLVKYDATGTLQWNKTWGGSGDNYGLSVIETSDGGYAIGGYTNSFGGYDAIILKYDRLGNLQWNKTWGGSGYEEGKSIIQTTDGGYVLSGITDSFGAGNYDVFIAKFNASGNLTWNKLWGSTAADYSYEVIQTADGGYAVTGQTLGFGATSGDVLFLRFDAEGALLQSSTKGGSGADLGNGILQTNDGGYAISGSTTSYGLGLTDSIVVKYDSTGTLTWTKTWGSTNYDYGGSIQHTSDGGYIIGGVTSGHGVAAGDFALIKLDANGNIAGCTTTCTSSTAAGATVSGSSATPSATVSAPSGSTTTPSATTSSPSATTTAVIGTMTFATATGGTGTETAQSTIQTSDGGYAMAGSTMSGGNRNALITKYDSGGTLSWSKAWGGADDDYATSIVQTSDGGFAVTGASFETGSGYNIFIAKYTSTGTLSWSSTAGDTDDDVSNAIIQTADGGFAVTGDIFDFGTGGIETAFYATFTSTGQFNSAQLWAPSYGYSSGKSIIQTNDGGFVFSGIYNDGFNGSDAFMAKFSAAGAFLWDKTWGGTGADAATSIAQTSDGGFVATGTTTSYGSGSTDLFLTKFDASTGITWSKVWGGSGAETGGTVIQTNDGGFAVSGSTASYGAGSTDSIFTKFDNGGTFTYSKVWGASGAETGNSIIQTNDSGFAIGGSIYNTFNSTDDVLLLKYNSAGEIINCSSLCGSVTPTVSSPSFINSNPSLFDAASYAAEILTTRSDQTHSISSSYKVAKAISTTPGALPGQPLAAQNTAAASQRHDGPVRLRVILKPNNKVAAGTFSLKLQVAPRVGTCDPSFTGESYMDVGSSAAFNYYDNPNLSNGQFALAGAFDPSPTSGSLRNGSYIESTGFVNRHGLTTTTSELFDISLTPTDSAVYGSYCFRIVKSDNSPLLSYSQVSELSIPPATSQQLRHGQFFDEQSAAGLTPYYW